MVLGRIMGHGEEQMEILQKEYGSPDLSNLRYISIDEFATHKGQVYKTIVVDLETRRIVFVVTVTVIAYYLKEDLREIWNQTNKADAELVLNEWVRQAMDSKIQPLVKKASTLRAYKPYILAWYDYPISNGPTKGINNKIKVLKRQMYGFRNDEFFTLKLYALHDKRLRI